MTLRRTVAFVVTLSCLVPFAIVRPARACTTAVVAGSATADGRPLLWKNRDADDLHNQVVYRDDGRYPYVGLVNQGDALGLQVWAGLNAKGFALMNSASYNVEDDDTQDEGRIMRTALASCATLAEFEALLLATNGPGRDVSANFGAIDATGAAAYFEVGRHGFRRFDATDPKVAPAGFLVRSNFSDSGQGTKGTGYLRRERATALIETAVNAHALTARTLLADVARDVGNARLASDPRVPGHGGAEFAYVGDSINREITSNAAVFSGVAPGEDPRFATAWIILGQPATGAAVPVWVAAGHVPAELAAAKDPAPLNAACDAVRARLYPSRQGELKKYVAADAVAAIVPALVALETKNFAAADQALEAWRKAMPDVAAIARVQDGIAKRTLDAMAAIPAPRR